MMNRRRRILYIIILLTVAIVTIYNSYEAVGRFFRLFVPHSGYPLNQDQALARFKVQKQQPKNVPRIIHQVLHNWRQHGNDSVLLPEWETQRQSCRDNNPEWEYKFWTEDMSRDFIRNEYPWFIKTYESFRYPIQREQTVRYFILRHYGGIYIDLDFGCVNSLESLRPYSVFISDHRRGTLADKVLGAAPNHPFWVTVTETIPRYSHWYPFAFLTVLYGTGRWFLTAAWDRWHWDNCQQSLFRYGPRPADWLTRLSMPQWRGAPEWSLFSSHRGGTAATWPIDIFVLGRKHWIVSIISGVVGCAIGVYLGVKLFRKSISSAATLPQKQGRSLHTAKPAHRNTRKATGTVGQAYRDRGRVTFSVFPVTVTGRVAVKEVRSAPIRFPDVATTSVGVTAADLLAYDNRQLDQFLREHDTLSLQGVLEISKAQRSQLARAIRARLDLHGGSPGSGQLDASELAARLTHVAGEPSRYPLDEPPRSPTESTEHTQSPADTQGYEDLCRQELVADGGHPIVGTAQELLQMCAQPKISCHAILAWLSDEHGDGGSGEEAFPAYLGAKTRIYERSGATRLVSSDSFKETIWRQWQTLRAFQQLPEKQSFSAYRDAVQMRIGRCQFKRGLQLKKDVHQQDSWTTLLEYLNYESWYWEHLTAKAELLEPAFFASRILLSGVETDSTSPTSNGRHFATKASSLDEKLAAAQADRDACRNMISAIRRAVRPYRKARYAAYRQRLRVDWVVELARTMETEMGQQGEGSITVGQSHGTGKRGCDDEPQPKKRAKQRVAAAHSASGANKTGLSMVTRQSARLAKRSSSRNPPRAEKSN